MQGFATRAWRAALLDPQTYEEVEADRAATRQALMVVLLSALGAGLGSIENSGASGVLGSTLAALLGWWIWAWVAYRIGTHMLPSADTSADHGELLRTIGFSSAPGILRIFAVIPAIAGWVYLLATLWMLVAMVVGVRQALDYAESTRGTLRAVAVCAIGFPIYGLFLVLSLLLLGPWPV
jgi:hypothetical protein